MAKINFTKEHYAKLKDLAFEMLVNNYAIQTKFGTPLSIVDLMHTQTIGTLNDIRLAINKQIEKLEDADEWASGVVEQLRMESLKEKKELVNLIIGWKRYNLEQLEIQHKKDELTNKLKELKESQKSPEDKIKEIEEELNSLDATEEF